MVQRMELGFVGVAVGLLAAGPFLCAVTYGHDPSDGEVHTDNGDFVAREVLGSSPKDRKEIAKRHL